MSGSIDLADVARGIGGFVIQGEDAGDGAAYSVASAGDVNGDGFDDLIVGASGADATGNAKNDAGAAYVVFGKAGGFAATVDLAQVAQGTGGFVVQGEDPDDRAGRSVASAGDVNGDGFDDLIVGAPIAEDFAGTAYVVFGKAGGFAASIDLGQVAREGSGFVIEGVSGEVGYSVGSAGDVNGDGLNDLFVSATGIDGAYVVFGPAGGFAASIDLAQLARGSGGFFIQGEEVGGFGDLACTSVASAGDVNGDGFDDLIVGAPRADGAGNRRYEAGAAYVVFGKSGGFGATIDLGQVARGTDGFVIQGQGRGDYAGASVASAGDVNGDGFDDLIVGAYRADAAANAKDGAGAAYVVFGKASGFEPSIDLVRVARGTGGFVIQGEDPYDGAGYSVASAGDVNGDGFDDLIVGTPRADAAGNAKDDAGAAYVLFGKAGGFRSSINLTDVARGNGGFVIQGEDSRDFAGSSVASAGDVNGDGFDDLIVGASAAGAAGNAKPFAGAAYVVFGGGFLGGDAPALGTDADDTLAGTGASDRIDAGLGDDRIGGAGGGDSLAGGDGDDRLRGNSGRDLLAGGLGDDTMVGGLGADSLAGGQGADAFRFRGAAQGGDLILDFAPGVDVIELSAAGFGLPPGEDLVAAARFAANAEGEATSPADGGQFVFDTDDYRLFWDADGAGGAAGVLLARFDDPVRLDVTDLRLIA